jgi:ATP-dependent RNA helicase DDX55/SPB4
MARGVDLPNVDWVIQYDPPSSAPAFVHRCGRTARNGQPGKALLMLLHQEEPYVKFLSLNQKVRVVRCSLIRLVSGKLTSMKA